MDSIILSNTFSETSDHHAIVRFVIFPFTTQNPKNNKNESRGRGRDRNLTKRDREREREKLQRGVRKLGFAEWNDDWEMHMTFL